MRPVQEPFADAADNDKTMTVEYAQQQPQHVHATFRLSWLAYFRPILVLALFTICGRWLAYFHHEAIAIIVVLVGVVWFIYRLMMTRSIVLFTDDHGVWLYQGIFPWSRGYNGVKWRDLEEAVFYTGFLSWIFKSYSIRVSHRFTREGEIWLRHVRQGNLAVEHINALHQQVLASSIQGDQ